MVDIFCSVSESEIKEVTELLIPSLCRLKGVSNLNLVLINYSGKKRVYKGVQEIGKLRITEVISKKRLGYGAAHNFGFQTVKPKSHFLITNPLSLHEDSLKLLLERSSKEIAMVEARQLPFMHPKEYNHKTGETPWATGACVLVNPKFFGEVGGFDENYFMYNEDVDLSWRAWIEGYKVIYEPNAIVYHFSGAYFKYREDRYHLEHLWSVRNFIYLMNKFWGESGERRAIRIINKSDLSEVIKETAINNYYQMKSKLSIQNEVFRGKDYPSQIKVLGLNKFHKIEESSDE